MKEEKTCATCNGSGEIYAPPADLDGGVIRTDDKPAIKRFGADPSFKPVQHGGFNFPLQLCRCPRCHGSGKV